MTFAILIFAVCWLAWSNGANDNFKGVATLYGCGTVSFRKALSLATVATVAGSLLSMVLASKLAIAFSGKGLVPEGIAGSYALLIAVGGAGAFTVLLATFLGMPTSTTHALTGALVGVSLVVSGGGANLSVLWEGFFQPLLVSPVLAVGGAAFLYVVLRKLRQRLGIVPESCVCVAAKPSVQPAGDTAYSSVSDSAVLSVAAVSPALSFGREEACSSNALGRTVGVGAQSVVDSIHGLSAVAVCFARAVNDTPKIAALLLATGMQGAGWKLGIVALAMAVGGWLNSRRVAETMSKRITDLNSGQGLTANLVTAGLVLGASSVGVPVSTTHVSCGAIVGIGVVNGRARWKTVSALAATWLTTLPLGAALGAGVYCLLRPIMN